jgi:succinate dehydrogenase / fumarate reductase cytochrome b subunit
MAIPQRSTSFASASTRAQRPVFLNLLQIRMPVGAWTSIGHRISGVLLAAAVPAAVWLLDLSLRDENGFDYVRNLFVSPALKGAAIVVVWALAHHVLAGIRHLASDFEVGSSLRAARRSAWVANPGAAIAALIAAGVLL